MAAAAAAAAQDDISDPTDWIGTPVASLEPLEAGLRCEICKDFYTAPVLTACCHTFCSGCIRRSLSSVNASRKCPLCWAPFDEGKLRKNKIVEELVKTFQAARGELLALGRAVRDGAVLNGVVELGRKRKADEIEDAGSLSNGVSPRKTRSQAQHKANLILSPGKSEEILPEEQEEGIEYQNDDGKVSCPICQQRMPEAQVFTHLDTHSEDKATTSGTFNSRLPNRTQPAMPTMTSLPTLSYSLLSDIQMRRKLRELGIPWDGNKQAMSRRHTEWRNLVNANCDSSNPKSKPDLLRELSNWERTQNSTNHSYAAKATKLSVMDKEFDRDNWSVNHNSDFQSLIAAARTKAKPGSKADHKVSEDKGIVSNHNSVESSKPNGTAEDPPGIPPSSQMSMVELTHHED